MSRGKYYWARISLFLFPTYWAIQYCEEFEKWYWEKRNGR